MGTGDPQISGLQRFNWLELREVLGFQRLSVQNLGDHCIGSKHRRIRSVQCIRCNLWSSPNLAWPGALPPFRVIGIHSWRILDIFGSTSHVLSTLECQMVTLGIIVGIKGEKRHVRSGRTRDLSEGKSMFKWVKPATHSHRIACGISSLVGQNFWRRLHATMLTALLDIATAFRIYCYSQLLKTTCFFMLFKPNFFSPCGIPPWSKPLFWSVKSQ